MTIHRMTRKAAGRLAFLAGASAVLAGCANNDGLGSPVVKPSFAGTVTVTTHDSNDDLLTAGLGRAGLASSTAPTYADTTRPTAAELRRAAIYNNYRALVDMTGAGGYGVLYGPNVDPSGVAGNDEGRIAGVEYRTFSDDGSGNRNVTLLVQVPNNFDINNPCIVSATASGSRGIYGGISTGEWGLKRSCAVAYTDKGTGAAPHDIANDTVPLIDGTRATLAAAGNTAAFRATMTAAERAAFNTATPNRFAFKHAHSQQNPEKDWGLFTLQAIEFAFYAINDRHGKIEGGVRTKSFVQGNTLVIASSISNGGGAALAAAEQDTANWIDGVAVSEPAVELPANPGVTVRRGSTVQATVGKTLIDFTTMANVLQSCASLAPEVAGTPFQASFAAGFGTFATARCTSLAQRGLVTGATTAARASNALEQLRAYGWEPESTVLHASLAAFEVAPAVSVTFANALARANVRENLCGYSFGSTTAAGVPNVLPAEALAGMFANGNGVPPSNLGTGIVQLINNANPAGPLRDVFTVSASSGTADWNLDGAICLRNLVTGSDANALRLQTGVNETRRSGNLRALPAIIVHGRDDALLPVNHTSRPYAALNKRVDTGSKLSYIEVTNAQHFDSFIGLPAVLPGYDTRYIPLHVYLNRALDAVYANLKNGTALPPSQVVRTTPRGGTPGAAPGITQANVPALASSPSAGNAISFTVTGATSTVTVPD